MKKTFILILLALVAFACPLNKITPEQQAYLNRAMQQPIPVIVSTVQAEEAWGRIQSFIKLCSSRKAQIATDYLIDTYNPADKSDYYFYKAEKKVKGNTVEINLEVLWDHGQRREKCDRNLHLLAYYIVTGKLIPELVFK